MDDKPDYQSDDYAKLNQRWQIVNDVLGGTEALRDKGETYLPKFPSEMDEAYSLRLRIATSDGDYSDTLDAVDGMIFRKPIKIGDKVPQRIKNDLENIDLRGTHFNVFAPRFAREGIHYGAAYILVDMQRKPVELASQVIDAAQAQDLNLRPYWTIYSAADLQTRPRYVTINGAKVLQQIVFKETVCLLDGDFADEEVERLRVWKLPVIDNGDENYRVTGNVEWALYEKQDPDDAKTSKPEFVWIAGDKTELLRIPVAPFVANPAPKDELCCAGPTMLDLAYLCIKDWQAQSDFENNLHYCMAIPWGRGLRTVGDENKKPWGMSVLIETDENGQVGFAEPQGNSFATWDTYLKGLKDKMRAKGLEMVLEGSAPSTTATEQIIRAGKRASRLTYFIQALHDCFERALGIHAEWIGLGADAGGEVTMGTTGNELVLTAQDIAAYSATVAASQMSLKTYWDILQRGGVLADEFDADKELQQIKTERETLVPPVTTLNPSRAGAFANNADPAIGAMFAAKGKANQASNGAAK